MQALSEHPDIIVGTVVDEIDAAEIETIPYWVDTYPILMGVLATQTGVTVADVIDTLDELGSEMEGAPDDAIMSAFMDSFILV